MSITPHLYFDNPVARDLIEHPEHWNELRDALLPIHGNSFEPYKSFYLFFEYLGLKKKLLNKLDLTPLQFKNVKDYAYAEKNASNIASSIDPHFKEAQEAIKQQLLSDDKKIILLNAISDKKKHEHNFIGSFELRENLFRTFLDDIDNDYPQFAEYASLYLAWDYFCSISPTGINLKILRQFQLRLWISIFKEHGTILPLGKLCDDFRFRGLKIKHSYRASLQKSKEATLEDMVDSEAITAVLFEKVVFLTYDSPDTIRERIKTMHGIKLEVEQTLNISIPTNFGKVYCLSRPPKIKIVDCIEPMIVIPMGQTSTEECI